MVILSMRLLCLRTEARWSKAVSHLKDRDALLQEPKDIGPLMKEVKQDILVEESDFIKEKLFGGAKDKVLREPPTDSRSGTKNGLPRTGFPA